MGNVTCGKVCGKSKVENGGSISPNGGSIFQNSVSIFPNGVSIFPNGGSICQNGGSIWLDSLENGAGKASGRCCSYSGSAKWRLVATDNGMHSSWLDAKVAPVAPFFALFYAHARGYGIYSNIKLAGERFGTLNFFC